MELVVRSNFKLAMRARNADGTVVRTGRFERPSGSVAQIGDATVPHLQRMDPSGRWLASYDADRRRIGLRSIGTLAGPSTTVLIDGVDGEIIRFRWHPNGRGLAVATTEQAYWIPLDPDAPPRRAAADAVFPSVDDGLRVFPQEVRMTSHGMAIHAYWRPASVSYRHTRQAVYFVPIYADGLGAPTPVVDLESLYMSMTVLAGDQLAVSIAQDVDLSVPDPKTPIREIRMFDASQPGQPYETGTVPCVGFCYVKTWSPGAREPLYWGDEGVVLEAESGRVTIAAPSGLPRALWMNAAGDRIAVASSEVLQVFDQRGRLQWTWRPPLVSGWTLRDYIGSVHFDRDDESLLVSARARLFRVRNGQGELLHSVDDTAKVDSPPGTPPRVLDAVLPLPDGGYAWSVVDAKWTTL